LNGALVDSPDSHTFIAYIPIGFTTSGAIAGVNTLTFQVYNYGGPTGLRVDGIAGEYTVVPEPATLTIALLCLGTLLMRRSSHRGPDRRQNCLPRGFHFTRHFARLAVP